MKICASTLEFLISSPLHKAEGEPLGFASQFLIFTIIVSVVVVVAFTAI
jgi:hypothetical protein